MNVFLNNLFKLYFSVKTEQLTNSAVTMEQIMNSAAKITPTINFVVKTARTIISVVRMALKMSGAATMVDREITVVPMEKIIPAAVQMNR